MARALRHIVLFAFLLVVTGGLQSPSALARATRPAPARLPEGTQLVPYVALPTSPIQAQTDGVSAEATLTASPAAGTGGTQGPAPASPASEGDEIDYPNTVMHLPGGTIVTPEHFYSTVLERNTWYEVVLPPGYDQGSRRYPVLYMLHGAAGGAAEWLEIGIHQTADASWSEGELAPFIIVLPEGGSSYWLNHANGGPRWGDHVASELTQRIDATYRTLAAPEFRAIGGLSMGGDGALQLALHHPDVFGIVGAHSPTTRLEYENRPGDFYGDFGYWQQNNPIWLIRNTDAAAELNIWIDMGIDDPWLPSARAIHEALLEQDVDHQYRELDGTHEAEYWEEYQGDYLQFYGSAFSQSAPLAARLVSQEQPE